MSTVWFFRILCGTSETTVCKEHPCRSTIRHGQGFIQGPGAAGTRRRDRCVGQSPASRKGLRRDDGGRSGRRCGHRQGEPVQALHLQGRAGRRGDDPRAGPCPGLHRRARDATQGGHRAAQGRGTVDDAGAACRRNAVTASAELEPARRIDCQQDLPRPVDRSERQAGGVDHRRPKERAAEPQAATRGDPLHAVRARLRPCAQPAQVERQPQRRSDHRDAALDLLRRLGGYGASSSLERGGGEKKAPGEFLVAVQGSNLRPLPRPVAMPRQ